MLNIFVSSTTYGQAMGATFEMDGKGSLADRRITQSVDVEEPVYEKEIDAVKVAELLHNKQTDEVVKMGKAIDKENCRVNTLAMLLRELKMVQSLDYDGMVIVYVHQYVFAEIQMGRVKFYINDRAVNPYFSKFELDLWKQVIEIVQSMYDRIIFKDLEKCKYNTDDNQVQADRGSIYSNMYQKLLASFRTEKASRNKTVSKKRQVVSDEALF